MTGKDPTWAGQFELLLFLTVLFSSSDSLLFSDRLFKSNRESTLKALQILDTLLVAPSL